MVDYTNFFNALSNQTRLNVLHLLNYNDLKTSQISKKLDLSIQALTPHITLLHENKIILKDTNDFLKLTPLGKTILLQIQFFEFCTKNKDFFKDHNFGDVPIDLISRLGCLNEFEFVDGFAPNLTRWKDIVNNAKSYLYCIFSQPPILVADQILDKLSQNIEFKLLFGKNTIISNHNEFISKLELTKPRIEECFQLRIADSVKINLILSDNHVSLMFPNKNFETDMHKSFVSKNETFLRWCHDFFNYKWNLAEKASRIRTPNT